MAKKSKPPALPADPVARVDSMFSQIYTHAKSQIGGQFVFGARAWEIMVGLPLPSLALEYMLYCTCWPLSRLASLVGKPGCGKTAFGFEVSRWHHVNGGGSFYGDCEHKDASHVRDGMFHYMPSYLARASTKQCYLLDEAQSAVFQMMESVRTVAEQAGYARSIPAAFMIDSLMGNVPESEYASMEKNEGAAERGYALSAQLIARWMRGIQHKIEDNPFSLLVTNHLREATDRMGNAVRTTPGGTSVPFFETLEIELKKLTSFETLECAGITSILKAFKNCVGPGGRSIKADFIWWWVDQIDPLTGEIVLNEYGVPLKMQHFAWDWDAATINMLKDVSANKPTLGRTIMDDACDLHFVGNAQRGSTAKVWSNALGIPEDDPQIYRVAGAAIQSNPAVMSRLRYQLEIMEMTPFQPGKDYKAALSAAQEKAKARVEAEAQGPAIVIPETPVVDVVADAADVDADTAGDSEE